MSISGENRATGEENETSTITASPTIRRSHRTAMVTVVLLVAVLVATVALVVSVAGGSSPRATVRSTPTASRVYSTRWGHPQ